MKLFEEFLYNLEHARGKSPNTIYAYSLHLKEFQECVFNNREVTVDDIKKLHAEDILSKWLRVKEKEDLTASSLNQRLATIKSLYKYLEGRREIQYNVTVSISQFKDKEKTEKVILSLDECKILLEVAANRVNERKLFETLADLLATQLFLGSGIRIEECSLLNIDSINVSERELILKAEQTKGKSKGGTISLPEEVIDTLLIYLPLRLEKNINIEDEDAKNALFISQKGNRLSTDQIRRRLYKIVEVAGLKHITPHALRHSFATNLLQNGASLELVSSLLRHSNINTTMNFYIHQKKEDTSKYNPVFNPTTKEVKETKEEIKPSKPQVVKDDTNVIQLRFA